MATRDKLTLSPSANSTPEIPPTHNFYVSTGPRHSSLPADAQRGPSQNANSQQVSFIMCDGPRGGRTSAARREVRSQAAKRSADQRKATMAQRYAGHSQAKTAPASKPERTRKRVPKAHAQPQEPTMSELPTPLPSPVVESAGRSADRYERADGQRGGFPVVARRFITNALSLLDASAAAAEQERSDHHFRVSSSVRDDMVPAFLALPIPIQAAIDGIRGTDTVPPPVVLGIRQHMLVVINQAISSGTWQPERLSATIAIAAGFELEFGNRKMADLHMRAAKDVVHNRLTSVHLAESASASGRSTPSASSSNASPPSQNPPSFQ